jgi:transposase
VPHGNARTTVHGRKLIVARHKAGWRQAHIAAAMGISRKCVRTWISRYAAAGDAGLADRSSRPHTSPTRTAVEAEDRIVATRTAHRRGPAWIGAELGVPARTVSRVLVRRGQPRLSALDPMTGQVIRSSKQTAVRYERSRPGELAHMDVKKLARIRRRRWLARPRPRGQSHQPRPGQPGRLRLRPLPGRRPLPAGLLRGAAR